MEALERRFDVEEKTKSGRQGTPTICCYNCNKEGHIRRNCPLLGREREQVRGRREGTDREWNKAPAQVCGCNLSQHYVCALSSSARKEMTKTAGTSYSGSKRPSIGCTR